jgi:hypothetical protein
MKTKENAVQKPHIAGLEILTTILIAAIVFGTLHLLIQHIIPEFLPFIDLSFKDY